MDAMKYTQSQKVEIIEGQKLKFRIAELVFIIIHSFIIMKIRPEQILQYMSCAAVHAVSAVQKRTLCGVQR